MTSRTLPRGLSFFHPVCLVSTFFGVGFLPIAPGTWGSFVALPLAWLIVAEWGIPALAATAVILFALGCWSCTVYERRTNDRDPQVIVIDEVAAQCLVLTVAPLDWSWFLAGFVLFRIADIFKPWPASWADRSVKGGFGIMLDDLFAALYAGALLFGLVILLG
jgi:phosphatidylglycerophosphatase A